MAELGFFAIFWIAVGAFICPAFVIGCIVSICKATRDRKAIIARNEARRSSQPMPQAPPKPLDIIAQEVRTNRWHRRTSSVGSDHVQTLLRLASKSGSVEYLDETRNGYTQRIIQNGPAQGAGIFRRRGSGDGDVSGSSETSSPERAVLHVSAGHGVPADNTTPKGAPERVDTQSREGVDNPAAIFQDEEQHGVAGSKRREPEGVTMIEMVTIGSSDEPAARGDKSSRSSNGPRYHYHAASNTTERPSDTRNLAHVKPARLASFDSEGSIAQSSPVHKRAERDSQPTDAHQGQKTRSEAEVHQHNSRSRPAVKKPPRQHSRRSGDSEVSSNEALSSRSPNHVGGEGEGQRDTGNMREAHSHPDLDRDTRNGRVKSRTTDLRHEELRSRSDADLASSGKDKHHSKHEELRPHTAMAGKTGKINRAFDNGSDREEIARF